MAEGYPALELPPNAPLLDLLTRGVWEREGGLIPPPPPDELAERLQRAEAYVRDAAQGRFRGSLWQGAQARTRTRLPRDPPRDPPREPPRKPPREPPREPARGAQR